MEKHIIKEMMERFFANADEKTKPLHRTDIVLSENRPEMGEKMSGNLYRFMKEDCIGVMPVTTPVGVDYYELVDKGLYYMPAGKNQSFSSYLVVTPVMAYGLIPQKIDENLGYEIALATARPEVGMKLNVTALGFNHSKKYQLMTPKEIGIVKEVRYFGLNLAYVITEESDKKYVISYYVE